MRLEKTERTAHEHETPEIQRRHAQQQTRKRGVRLEKRSVTISIGGKLYRFLSDDSEEYILALERRVNEAMKQTAPFSGMSSHTNAVLTALLLADELLRTERNAAAASMPRPPEVRNRQPAAVSRKNTVKAAGQDNGQISIWDLPSGPHET